MMKLFSITAMMALLVITPRIDNPDRASVGGRITEERLVPIPGASVSARNTFSGEVETVKSDSKGLYIITGLRQGRYSLFVQAQGYCSVSIYHVALFRSQFTQLDITLSRSMKKLPVRDCTEAARESE
jgi:hypothetical protein